MSYYYRNALWFAKGLKEYTNAGYQRASKHFQADDLQVSCVGKVFLVTGAERGLGRVVAYEMAKRGGTVHMVCQNVEKGEETKKDLLESTRNKNIHLHIVDLAEPQQVLSFTREFVDKFSTLHVMVHNAGPYCSSRQVNSLGMEINFARHVLGTHVLTTHLVPLLNKVVEPRVIMVSTPGMLLYRLVPDNPNLEGRDFDPAVAFCQNKRRQAVMAERYAELYPGIHFSSALPGWAASPGVLEPLPKLYSNLQVKLRSDKQAADTIVWLAISQNAMKCPSGLLYLDRRPVRSHLPFAQTRTPEDQDLALLKFMDEFLERYASD